jgi:AcrR family transcriptional regulator
MTQAAARRDSDNRQGSANRRGSATSKEAILHAARERFARDGYERATIRAIAAEAGIDPAMVIRYFGSKERLFASAAEFETAIPDLTGVPRREVGATLVRHFLHLWGRDGTFLALLRAAVTNQAAADRMQEVFRTQVAPALAGVVPDEPERRAGLVGSQLLGIALTRYAVRLPPVLALSDEELVAHVAPTIQRYLTGRW